MGWTAAIITAIIAYLIGSLNASIIISRVFLKEDIRNSGSGNAGATNMLRTYGKGFAIATLLFDVLKGVVAVLLAALVDGLLPGSLREGASFANSHLLGNLGYIAGLFAAIGHNFPVFFGFKGGKGVATGIGVIFALNPAIGNYKNSILRLDNRCGTFPASVACVRARKGLIQCCFDCNCITSCNTCNPAPSFKHQKTYKRYGE